MKYNILLLCLLLSSASVCGMENNEIGAGEYQQVIVVEQIPEVEGSIVLIEPLAETTSPFPFRPVDFFSERYRFKQHLSQLEAQVHTIWALHKAAASNSLHWIHTVLYFRNYISQQADDALPAA